MLSNSKHQLTNNFQSRKSQFSKLVSSLEIGDWNCPSSRSPQAGEGRGEGEDNEIDFHGLRLLAGRQG